MLKHLTIRCVIILLNSFIGRFSMAQDFDWSRGDERCHFLSVSLPRTKITLAVKRSTAGCKCCPAGLTGPKFNLHQPEKSNAGLREISSLKVK